MRRSTLIRPMALLAAAAFAVTGCSADTEALAPRSSAEPPRSGSTAIASGVPTGGASSTSAAGQASSAAGSSATSASGPSGATTDGTAGATIDGTEPAGTDQPGNVATEPPPEDPATEDSATDDPTTDLPPTAAGLPDGWPAEVRLPPGAETYSDPAGTDAGRSLAFRAPGSPADLAGFFDAELTAAGYAKGGGSDADGAVTRTYTRDGSTVDVTLVAGEDASVGTVTVTP